MFSISDILSALDLLDRLFKRTEQQADLYANEDYRVLGAALEEVYFRQDGVLSVLRALAEGSEITDELRQRMFRFNYIAPDVEGALQRVMDAAADREKLSLADREELSRIRDLKTGVRWSIAQLANHAVNMNAPYDPADVRKVIARIKSLNGSILAIETKLRQRMRLP